MIHKIRQDAQRFRAIVRGRIKQSLRQYISHGEMIARQGGRTVSVPLPEIELPRFVCAPQEQGGVGQGEGEPGTPLGADGSGAGPGAGAQPGEHLLEVEIELAELARILGEELELPRIQPRGKREIHAFKERYTSIRRSGPESLRHFKRSYLQGLKRQIATGLYDPSRPIVYPEREDRRYRSQRITEEPESNAVIIYMMDVSGSMGHEQKEIVRIETFWLDTWLRSQYRQLECRYIVHDVAAKEVDRETFFRIRESGGTKISSAYRAAQTLMETRFHPEDWNVYLFHFSDGDNWGGDDTKQCLEVLEQRLLPAANLVCYGQVKSAYGSGQFIKDLREHFPRGPENLVLSEIEGREGIYDSIKAFLGKGR